MTRAGGGRAARMWASRELRRRWAALVVLGLLAGVTTGLATAAVAGARRTDTAWERLRDVTQASDAIVFASQAGIVFDDELGYDAFADLPYVEAIGAFGIWSGTGSLGTLADSCPRTATGSTGSTRRASSRGGPLTPTTPTRS
ncbi:MAG: hypothetical protein ACRD0U_15080 [Acidimicrobiales bacterium]